MTVREQVAAAAVAAIQAEPNGIRWAELIQKVRTQLPNVNPNTVVGSLQYFQANLPAGISKPERGLYVAHGNGPAAIEVEIPKKAGPKEQDFYEPFATWLRDEMEEVTVAAALGGNHLKEKWGTPDVIGLYRPSATDPIKFSEELVAAEIKTDAGQMIVAFGQACAYKLFAHRVYLVVPKSTTDADIERLDALSGVLGIGLVLFDAGNPSKPNFEIRRRPDKHEPDYFHTNRVVKECAGMLKL